MLSERIWDSLDGKVQGDDGTGDDRPGGWIALVRRIGNPSSRPLSCGDFSLLDEPLQLHP
jgi:hypothetical protein